MKRSDRQKAARAADARKRLADGGRILVTRLHYLGDVVLTLPLVEAIHRLYPAAEIDYLARGRGAELLRGEPLFSRVLRLPEKGEGALAMLQLIRELHGRRYAAAVDLYSNPRSALLTWLTRAPLRIGGAHRGRRHYYTHPTRVPADVRAATEHHLYFGRALGIDGGASKPTLHLTAVEQRRAVETLRQLGAVEAPTVGIHPGGKWEVKRWPTPYFGELADRLRERAGFQIVVFCGPGEEPYREALRERLGERAVYAPTLPVRETAAIIRTLDGMVVCDGGMMHVSCAVGVPTVGIFGSSEHEIWFPYDRFGPYVAASVPITCRPCHSHFCSHLSCLHKLTVDMVERKLLEVVRTTSSIGQQVRGEGA